MVLRHIQPGARLSQAVVANGFIFLSGQASDDPAKDIYGQTRDVLGRIDALLEEAGSDRDNIVFVDIALADINDYAGMNAAWDEWIAGRTPPARACSEKRVSRKPYLVEMSVIALAG